MTDNERTCKLVKIVATNDIGKPLANDNIIYLLDKQTMTVYAPWATCESLDAFGLMMVDLPEKRKGHFKKENLKSLIVRMIQKKVR